MKKKIKKKGEYGYFSWEKRKRAAVTLGMFLLLAALFTMGYVKMGGRKNLFTLATILGCLPACKSFVGWLMMLPRNSMERECYGRIKGRAGHLTVVYDLYFTTYEKNALVDALAIDGETVAGFCSRRQEHRIFMEGHIQDMLKKSGCSVTVRLFEEPQAFMQKLDAMNRSGGPPAPAQTEKIQKIQRAILAIAL